MLEVNFEAVKAKNIVTGKVAPIPAIKGKDGEDSVAREEIASIKSSLVDKIPITYIAEDMEVEDFLKMPDGLYFFDSWLNVDDSETEWSESGNYGFDGLVWKYSYDGSGEHTGKRCSTIDGIGYGAYYLFEIDNPIPFNCGAICHPSPRQRSDRGIAYYYNDGYALTLATQTNIRNRKADKTSFDFKPIDLSVLDYAVKYAMCDGKGKAWTEEEQKNAQIRLGILSSEGVTF